MFAWAIGAGLLAVVALAGFWIVLVRLVPVPPHALPAYTRYPLLTVVLVLVMAALAGAIAEEAGFRGYFRGVLERVVGGPAAIGIAALVIAPEHALTQGFVWPILLFYLCVDVMLGLMAYLTPSILPTRPLPGDACPLGRDRVRGRSGQVPHHLPADRRVRVEQPVDDGQGSPSSRGVQRPLDALTIAASKR